MQSPKKIGSIRRTISLFRQPRVEMRLAILEELPNNKKELHKQEVEEEEELTKQEEKQQVLAVVAPLLVADPR